MCVSAPTAAYLCDERKLANDAFELFEQYARRAEQALCVVQECGASILVHGDHAIVRVEVETEEEHSLAWRHRLFLGHLEAQPSKD